MIFTDYVAISFGKDYECGGIFSECRMKHEVLDILLELESLGKIRIEYRGMDLIEARISIADKIQRGGIIKRLNSMQS